MHMPQKNTNTQPERMDTARAFEKMQEDLDKYADAWIANAVKRFDYELAQAIANRTSIVRKDDCK